MLKTRVLTAAILAPLFVLGVLKLPGGYFTILIGLVVLAGAWEWAALSGYDGTATKTGAVAGTGVLMAAAYFFRDTLAEPLFILACLAWLAVAASLFRHRHHGLIRWPRPLRLLSGAGALVPAWLAISMLQGLEPAAALMLFLLIWAADTGAYFAGRRWGRRKLAPAISPGKTVEGVLGAAAAAVLVAAGFALYRDAGAAAWTGLVAWSLVVVLVSIGGDLFESNWKRLASLKDSGGLLPGHGGVLDRIDSMNAAAPFFALGWVWWFASTPA